MSGLVQPGKGTWHSGGGTGFQIQAQNWSLMLPDSKGERPKDLGRRFLGAYDPRLGGVEAGDPDCSLKSLLAGVKFAVRGCGMETACHTKPGTPVPQALCLFTIKKTSCL